MHKSKFATFKKQASVSKPLGCQLRVAETIDMDDFENSDNEEEPEENLDKNAKKDIKSKKKKSKSQGTTPTKKNPKKSKWYAEFVDFHKKRSEIAHLLKDNARRGSANTEEIKEGLDRIWISDNEKQMASAVVMTLLKTEKGPKNSLKVNKKDGEKQYFSAPEGNEEVSNTPGKKVKKKKSILKKKRSKKNLKTSEGEEEEEGPEKEGGNETPKTKRYYIIFCETNRISKFNSELELRQYKNDSGQSKKILI